MRKRIQQVILSIILVLSLSACNLELVESPADADILLTITANAAMIEAAGQPGTEEPLPLEGNVAPPADEVVIPAEILPPAVGDVTVTVSVATNCRSGPGQNFANVYGMPVGQVAKVVAKNSYSGYWIIEIPGQAGQTCWLWGKYASISGNTASLKDVVTPTSAATPKPTATASATPTATQSSSSGTGAVTGCMDPNGSNYDPKATISGPCSYTKPNAPVLGSSFVNCTPAANGQMDYNVTLSWSDKSNNEASFNIATNLSLKTANANSTSYSFTETYPAGTVLNVSLTAYNNAGNSTPATTTFTCAPTVTRPNKPSGFTGTVTCTAVGGGQFEYSVSVTWVDNSNNEDLFNVWTDSMLYPVSANTTSFNFKEILPAGTTMTVGVYAENSVSTSASAGPLLFVCT